MNRNEISKLFNALAKKYDKANIFFSLGIDLYWRSKLIENFPQKKYIDHLDVACGTGEIIKRAAKKFKGKFIGVDISKEMIEVAKKKLSQDTNNIVFKEDNGQELSFADNSFDVVTNAFGLRNFYDYKKGISETYRVLRPNGVALFLEFQIPKNPVIKCFYRCYLHIFMPILGKLFLKDSSGWKYLGASIEYFAKNVDLIQTMKEQGFTNTEKIPMTFMIATIYKGTKK